MLLPGDEAAGGVAAGGSEDDYGKIDDSQPKKANFQSLHLFMGRRRRRRSCRRGAGAGAGGNESFYPFFFMNFAFRRACERGRGRTIF